MLNNACTRVHYTPWEGSTSSARPSSGQRLHVIGSTGSRRTSAGIQRRSRSQEPKQSAATAGAADRRHISSDRRNAAEKAGALHIVSDTRYRTDRRRRAGESRRTQARNSRRRSCRAAYNCHFIMLQYDSMMIQKDIALLSDLWYHIVKARETNEKSRTAKPD